MTTLSEADREVALTEYRELHKLVVKYVDIITATERFALAGASAFAAFSVSGLTDDIAQARGFISFIPFLIVSLAGLRCLSFYLIIRGALKYLETLEQQLPEVATIGYQRNFSPDVEFRISRMVEYVSGGFWALATVASLAFWLVLNGIV